jgi:hypothetical protein
LVFPVADVRISPERQLEPVPARLQTGVPLVQVYSSGTRPGIDSRLSGTEKSFKFSNRRADSRD